MSKRKVQMASKYGLSMPSVMTPYGHKRLTRKQTHAIRLEEERLAAIRKTPRIVEARPPLVRKKAPEG